MTTSVQPRVPKQSFQQRMVQGWQSLFAAGDLTTLIITVALLVIPALSLQASNWTLDMSVILPIAVLSVLFGFLLARSRFNELLALFLSIGYGTIFVTLLAAMNVPGGTYSVVVRAASWGVDALTGGINTDELVFTLLVGILFWFLGYNAAWHVFRIDRVWRVVLPPGLILVTNAVFYTDSASLNIYLMGYMFLALLLIARSNLDAREWEWYSNGIRIPPTLRRQFLRVGAVLAMVTLLIAWAVPSGNLQEQLNSFQEFLRSEPLTQMNEFWNRLFTPIETDGPTSADYYGGDSLELSGAIRLGDQEVFYVQAPPEVPRYYWRSRVFDTYERGRWASAADIRLTSPNPPFNIATANDAARQRIDQTFTVALRSFRLVHTAPQPASISIPTRTDLMYTAPDGSPDRAMNISVIRPTNVLERGEQYSASSLMSVATADQLRGAGTTYPAWIQNHPQYLRATPNVISDRTIALAFEIVNQAGVTNSYDKAKAIEYWLRSNITYSETIPQPPEGVDRMDWFLFDLRQGYCNYYATAMVVMLRSQGIPARMAGGFAQGEWDPNTQSYIVRERDAHTWVEAYFPGYGWIEFEPTSAQAPLVREGDLEVAPLPNNVQQQATATATATATPLPPTPTTAPTETAENPEEDSAQNPQPSPTLTPTYTPSPTQTPVIIPTQPAPVRPDPRDPLSMVLSALGIGLLGLVAILLIVGLFTFIYWWWEWRGMRGLSPITRAYARLERYLKLLGITFLAQQTPEERRRRIMRDLPGAERPVTAITRLYMTERYGPDNTVTSARQSDTADKAWGEARSSILKRMLRRLQFWRREDR
jgi:transglutaminase-like putative cysteine protease